MILILEDDPDLRDIVAELLRCEGYDVMTAADGHDALAQLARLESRALPCLILVDMGMPRMDGLAFRRAQRSDARLREIPLAFMTGASLSRETLAALSEDERAEVLRKPIGLDTLLDFVAARVRRSGVRRTAPPSDASLVKEERVQERGSASRT